VIAVVRFVVGIVLLAALLLFVIRARFGGR
jgi:hypothetical protein